jgi:glucose-6-phosphate isomerase
MSVIQLSPKIAAQEIDLKLLEVCRKISRKDFTLWGKEAESEAAIRLGWVKAFEDSRRLLPQLDALYAWVREKDFSEILLSGMGGSSLGPEVIAKCADKKLRVLDSTNPSEIQATTPEDLSRSAFIFSSKSGSTIETFSQFLYFQGKYREQNLDEREHFLIITDPNSPFAQLASENNYRVIFGDQNVGGRFSVLTAFGLAPAAMLGIDVSLLLDDAEDSEVEILGESSPAVKLASFIAAYNHFYFRDEGSKNPGFSDWLEQLIAESTGKAGRGVLPVVSRKRRESLNFIDFSEDVIAPLGAQFLLWEYVTAILGYSLKVNPFDQPNVQSTKEMTKEYLYRSLAIQGQIVELEELLPLLDQKTQGREYIAVHAYLNRMRDGELETLSELLEERYQMPVTFGWGPRFLHSTGQYHKGGPQTGVFLQIGSSYAEELPVPGRDYSFAQLAKAQQEGDAAALTQLGNDVVVVNLHGESRNLQRLLNLFN